VTYLIELIVSESLRGKGIGRKLMQHTENFALENAIDIVKLDVWENNEHSIEFHLKNKYVKKNYVLWKTLSRKT